MSNKLSTDPESSFTSHQVERMFGRKYVVQEATSKLELFLPDPGQYVPETKPSYIDPAYLEPVQTDNRQGEEEDLKKLANDARAQLEAAHMQQEMSRVTPN